MCADLDVPPPEGTLTVGAMACRILGVPAGRRVEATGTPGSRALMDPAKQQAIGACGNCGHDERAHQHKTGTDPEAIGVLAALGGPCLQFVASDASVIYQKHLAITDNRAPARRPGGAIGKRPVLCPRCGHRGHRKEDCPL